MLIHMAMPTVNLTHDVRQERGIYYVATTLENHLAL